MGNLSVKYGAIKIPQEPHIEKREMPDGSFQAYVYDKAKTESAIKFSEDKFYDYSTNAYKVSYRATPEIKERKILLSVSVVRTSIHSFKVIVLTPTKTIFESVRNSFIEISRSVSLDEMLSIRTFRVSVQTVLPLHVRRRIRLVSPCLEGR